MSQRALGSLLSAARLSRMTYRKCHQNAKPSIVVNKKFIDLLQDASKYSRMSATNPTDHNFTNGQKLEHEPCESETSTANVTLPHIDESFGSCQSYLIHILENFRNEPNPQEWEFILGEVIDTLPAQLYDGAMNKSQYLPKVTSLSKDSFVFRACLKICAIHAGLSYMKYLREKRSEIDEITLTLFFKLISRRPCEVDLMNSKYEHLIMTILSETRDLDNSHPETLAAYAAALAVTPNWRDGLEVIKPLEDHNILIYTKRCLALVALHNEDYQTFWTILNSSEFHLDAVGVRESLPGAYESFQDEVFVAYLKHCREKGSTADKETAWSLLEKLFQYFRDVNLCVRSSVEEAIVATVDHLKLCVDEVATITTISKGSNCRHCGVELEQSILSHSDIKNLRDAVYKKVLVKEDIYQSTVPKEVARFQERMGKNSNYDVVVDGLNVACARWPNTRFKSMEQQSISLLETLKVLDHLKLSALVIHRPMIYKYPHIKAISELCDFIIFDKVTEDDPYFILAALHCGPETKLLTNDTLRQHFHLLKDTPHLALFTKWQLSRQIYYFQQVQKNRGKIKLVPNLYFPPRHVCIPCRSETHWHLPLDHRGKIEDGRQKNIVFPKSWLCIPKPSRSSRTFMSLI